MNRLKGKKALITGATAGIGKAIAHQLADLGVHLILTGRRSERLVELKSEIESSYGVQVQTLHFDIRSNKEVEDALSEVDLESVDLLINNAGLAAGVDPVHKADLADWEQMIDTNIKGLLYISRLITPVMAAKKSGHVLNLGSIAGHEAYPGGVVYTATKHAVTAINKAMKMDLHGTNVRVSMISPGLVNTEFSTIRFKGDSHRADSVYAGIDPLVADDIAEIAVFILNRPAHVDIMDVVVFPTAQSAATMVFRG
ncbi:SDR family NAD(P)-dependent oxidoreductase [bacterium]|nr:MAG: SDR family NAD(P)-dependent oxidoreductase [bacterium]